jgi:hypothetical protein
MISGIRTSAPAGRASSESLIGGNHLRVWRQNGDKAHTNALFLAYVNQRVTSLLELIVWCVRVNSISQEKVSRNLNVAPLLFLNYLNL